MEFLRGENDFYTSVWKAFSEIDKKWRDYPGLVVYGSHNPDLVKEKMEKIRLARENKIPFLGICFGMQLAAIEYAKNVLRIKNANSREFGRSGEHIVKKIPFGLHIGMDFVEGRQESFWHNYYVDWHYFLKTDFSVTSANKEISYEMRLRDHPFFMGIQYHPEYQSSKNNPHPVLKEFITACKNYEQRTKEI